MLAEGGGLNSAALFAEPCGAARTAAVLGGIGAEVPAIGPFLRGTSAAQQQDRPSVSICRKVPASGFQAGAARLEGLGLKGQDAGPGYELFQLESASTEAHRSISSF